MIHIFILQILGTSITMYYTFIRYKKTGHLHDHRARKHTNVKPYKCKLCDESFDVAKYRTAHMETAHRGVKIEPNNSDYSPNVAPDPVSTPSGSRLRSKKGKNVTSSPSAKIFTEGNNKLTAKRKRKHSEEMDEPMAKKKPKTVCNHYIGYSYIVFCKLLIETHYLKFKWRIVFFSRI